MSEPGESSDNSDEDAGDSTTPRSLSSVLGDGVALCAPLRLTAQDLPVDQRLCKYFGPKLGWSSGYISEFRVGLKRSNCEITWDDGSKPDMWMLNLTEYWIAGRNPVVGSWFFYIWQ